MKLWEILNEARSDRGDEISWRRDAMSSNAAAYNRPNAPAWELQNDQDPDAQDWVVKAGNTIIFFKKTKADAEALAANPVLQQKYAVKYGKLTVRYQPV
jgi:hypothetical protein